MSEKRVVHEGKEVGKAPTKQPGDEIEVATGSQDGQTTYKKFIVESTTEDAINVREKPILG